MYQISRALAVDRRIRDQEAVSTTETTEYISRRRPRGQRSGLVLRLGRGLLLRGREGRQV